ncbi:MAG: hypothetical protein R3C18_05615 [Planctomycetaceae bacterium]
MYAKTRSRRISHQRAAFSLIELVIVITIVIVLMGFLLVGVNGARRRARVVQCSVEISNLDKAIADFKSLYGVEPPSFVILYEQGEGSSAAQHWGDDPTNGNQYRLISRAAVRSIWPRFNFAQNNDINMDGDADDVLILNGAECLAFFLGGTDDPAAAGWQATGFAANPQSPFAPVSYDYVPAMSQPAGTPAAVTNRRGPFFEGFDSSRFVDLDPTAQGGPDGMPEYLDSIPDQQLPLQYFSSYGGTGYRPRGLDKSAGNFDDESSVPGFVSHYIVANNAGSGADPTPTSASTSYNQSSHQIISPGFDFEFGSGGVYNGSNLPSTPESYFAGPREVVAERDNITNFKGGTLN